MRFAPLVRLRVVSLARLLAVALACGVPLDAARAAEPDLDSLRMNELQYVGTHNSYHVREKPIKSGRATEWNYTHAPLDVQLDRGVRSFELDLHQRDGEFLVFHVPLIDEGTTCRTLGDAMTTVRRWSEAHPRHVPISFLFELKREGPGIDRRIKKVDAAYLDELDAALRAGFAEGQILTPDDVRGESKTLREAVTTAGWPVVAECRGKVLFVLHDQGEQRALYTQEHPSLRGRVMFVRSDESRDDGATLVLDDPRDPDIPRLARAGYFIRTRADAGLKTDSPGQPARRDRAWRAGPTSSALIFPPESPTPQPVTSSSSPSRPPPA